MHAWQDWTTKCHWDSCSDCAECPSAPPPSPMMPPPPPEGCSSKCAMFNAAWQHKCAGASASNLDLQTRHLAPAHDLASP